MALQSILWGGPQPITISLAGLAASPTVGVESTTIALYLPPAWPGTGATVAALAIIQPTSANAGGYAYQCTTPGTTGSSQPSWGQTVGGTTADSAGGGTAVWTCLGNLDGCVDLIIGFQIVLAAGTPSAGAAVQFYFGMSPDGTNFTDNLTGSNASLTLRSPSNLWQAPAYGTLFTPASGGLSYKFYMQWSMMFGSLPPPWLDVVVINNTGVAFGATESAIIKTFSPCYGVIV